MINFNELYVDIAMKVEDGQLDKRQKAINLYLEKIDSEDIYMLVRLYFGMEHDGNEFDNFVSAFVEEDNNFSERYIRELEVLAGATLLAVANSESDYRYLAELLVLTTSFFKKPAAGSRVLTEIKDCFDQDRRNIRESINVASNLEFDDDSIDTDIEEIKSLTAWNTATAQKIGDLLTDIFESTRSLREVIDDFSKQKSIYFEDSQLLWWMMSEWSSELDCSLREIDSTKGTLVIGYEAATYIANYPGPYSMEGIIKKLVHACKGNKGKVKLTSVMAKIDPRLRKSIKEASENCKVIDLLPITNAVRCSEDAIDEGEWYPRYIRGVDNKDNIEENTCDNYAWQFYLECLVISIIDHLANSED